MNNSMKNAKVPSWNIPKKKAPTEQAILLAIEFGFKSCEKGNNLEQTFYDYKKIMQP